MNKFLIVLVVILTLAIIGLLLYFLVFRKSSTRVISGKLLKNGDVVFFVDLQGKENFSEKIYSNNRQYFTAIQNTGIWAIFKSANNDRVKIIISSMNLLTYKGGNLYNSSSSNDTTITNTNIKGDAYLVMNDNGFVQLLDSNGNERWNSK